MRLRLLAAAAAALTLAACGESPTSPVSPVQRARTGPRADIECRSGYFVATREDGSTYCAPEGFNATSGGTGGTTTAPDSTMTIQ